MFRVFSDFGSIRIEVSSLLFFWVAFKTKKLSTKKLVMFFVITAAGLYIIRPIVLYALTSYWLWPSQVLYNITSALNLPFSQEFDTRNLALVVAIAIVLVYNYLLYKYYVFNEKIK